MTAAARYRQRHPERVVEQATRYRETHSRALRLKGRLRERRRRAAAWLAVLNAFGAKCARCGFADPRALQIDHVHDDGYIDKWDRTDTVKFKKTVLAEIQSGRYQLLCANCNWIKRRECEKKILDELELAVSEIAPSQDSRGESHHSRTHPERLSRGERRYNAKLTEDAVREIRISTDTALSLGRRFGVDPTLIKRVRDRRAWVHVI